MIHIIADTTCVLPSDQCKELGITVLPQMIIFKEKTYRDDIDFDTISFLGMLKKSAELPKTAAPPPSLYAPIFQNYSLNKDSIIVICPSSDISGTYRNAMIAAREFPGADIHVIDTRTVAGGLANLVLLASQLVRSGLDADTIVNQICQKQKHERMFFMVDTLEYLAKGGRIGNAKAMVGGILQLKPILTLKDGINTPYENQRTRQKAIKRIIELVTEVFPASANSGLNITHSGDQNTALEIAHEIGTKRSISQIPIYNQCASIITHVGPGALAISYFDSNTLIE